MPRIFWLAILVCILGAAFLFRTQNQELPAGIGETQTVVTAPEVASKLEAAAVPRSGEVDIAEQRPALTPEKAKASEDAIAGTRPATTAPANTQPATKPTVAQKQAGPARAIKPAARGPYVVQIGSFGEAANADQEASRLTGRGWDARVKVGNTSDGTIIYRVQIGFFKSRHEAADFISLNSQHMKGAIPIHR